MAGPLPGRTAGPARPGPADGQRRLGRSRPGRRGTARRRPAPPVAPSAATTIPKVFHHVWLGSPLPEKARRNIQSWREMHPGWEFRLWTDQSLPPLPRLQGQFDAAATAAGKADMVRYEVIFAHGGVYVDADVECHCPIDGLLEGCRCFVAAEYHPASYNLPGPSGIGNDIFGAIPRHPAILEVIQAVPSCFDAANPLASGPWLFRRVMHIRPDVRIFEKDLFHPFLPHQVTPDGRTECPIPDHAYAVHWFNRSWAAEISSPDLPAGAGES